MGNEQSAFASSILVVLRSWVPSLDVEPMRLHLFNSKLHANHGAAEFLSVGIIFLYLLYHPI